MTSTLGARHNPAGKHPGPLANRRAHPHIFWSIPAHHIKKSSSQAFDLNVTPGVLFGTAPRGVDTLGNRLVSLIHRPCKIGSDPLLSYVRSF